MRLTAHLQDAEFATYVAARRAVLYRTAYLLCGDAHQAEDIVQTALAKVYVAWPRMGRDRQPDAYVRRIVVNAHIDETRRPWRRESVALDAIPEQEQRSGLPHEEIDALWRALRGLPPGQRRVVVLRHYWGLSVDETATDLGVSPGTVKSQSAAALARLRVALAPDRTFEGERT